ncbi:MAG: hypothetical protein WC331_10585 [Candidatus Omnitrophota bacterium]
MKRYTYTVEIGYALHLYYTSRSSAMLAAKRAARSKEVVTLTRTNNKTGETVYLNPDGSVTLTAEKQNWRKR